jgi:hypothetical protein
MFHENSGILFEYVCAMNDYLVLKHDPWASYESAQWLII